MKRCLELALNGNGYVAPNPMVGSVIVSNGRIIGEGFHTAYGKPHAEVEAINSVAPDTINELPASTLFVNLEPCTHHGKTPPCVDLIIEKKIGKVVIATADPNPIVAGRGIKKLREHGVEVIENILGPESKELNKRFFTLHKMKRPYIILKWAQTADGFMAPIPKARNQISNQYAQVLAHKWRSEEQAIMIGYNTALIDDPLLDVRFWEGNNPLRIVYDPKGVLPANLKLFQNDSPLIIFNNIRDEKKRNTEWIKVNNENFATEALQKLYARNIISVLVEGGASLLNQFIKSNLWDEGRVFESGERWGNGLSAPILAPETLVGEENINNNKLIQYRNR